MSDTVFGWSEGLVAPVKASGARVVRATASAAVPPPPPPKLARDGRERERSLRVALLLISVVILNGVDLAYTLLAHRLDSFSDSFNEMNPIAESFFREGLEPSLICFKILMVLCGTFMLWRVRRSRWTMPACWVLVIAYGLLGVTWYMWVKEVSSGLEMKMAAAEWGRRVLHH